MILESFFLLFLLFTPSLYPQDEELNKLLRDELGIEQKDKKKKDTTQSLPKKEDYEQNNPIRERYVNTEESSSTTLLWILVRIFLVLAILIGALYYILRFLNKNKGLKYPVKGEMRLISHLPLGAGRELQIVEVSGMLLVLGVSEHSITLIKEITDPLIKERIFLARDSFEPPKGNFIEELYKVVTGGRVSKSQESQIETLEQETEILEEIQRRQKSKLEELKRERDRLQKKEK